MKFEMADINDLLSLVKLRTDYLLEDYGEIPEDKLDTIKNKSIGFKDIISKYHNMKYAIDLNNESN